MILKEKRFNLNANFSNKVRSRKSKTRITKKGYKIGIIHLVNLKPFEIKKEWIEAIKKLNMEY